MLYKRENTVSKTPGIAHESNAVRHLQTLHDITILLPREEKLHESDPGAGAGLFVEAGYVAAKMNVIRATMMTNRRATVRICVAGYAEDDGSDPAVPSASGVCVSAVSAAGSLKRFDTLLLWVHLSIVKFMLCERYVSAAGCGNCAL